MYEHVKTNRDWGEVAISASKEPNPSFVCDEGKEVVAITIDIHMKNIAICVTPAYGSLENAPVKKKTGFLILGLFIATSTAGKTSGKGYILQGGLNAWLGLKALPVPGEQNANGKLFQIFLEENKLRCENSLALSKWNQGEHNWFLCCV